MLPFEGKLGEVPMIGRVGRLVDDRLGCVRTLGEAGGAEARDAVVVFA